MLFYGFFFFKQKTAYEMRISDWSSDVCSSDLMLGRALRIGIEQAGLQPNLQSCFKNARGFVDIALRLLDAGRRQGYVGQRPLVGFQVASDGLEAFRATGLPTRGRRCLDKLQGLGFFQDAAQCQQARDRKSTRLTSSH